MAKMWPAALALLVFCGCWDSVDQKKERDLETQRLLYLALITTTDSTSACIQNETQALSCASQAGLTSTYMSTMRSLYSIPTTTSTASALCTDLASSFQYSIYSQAARACIMGCYKAFFARQTCTAGTYGTTLAVYAGCSPLVVTNCTDAAVVSCVNACLRTGNPLF